MEKERRESSRDPLESYVARRLTRLRIVSARVLSSIASGLVGGYAGYRVGALACLASAVAALLLYVAIGLYAVKLAEKGMLKRSEAWTAGVISSVTGFLIGLYLGSALAFS